MSDDDISPPRKSRRAAMLECRLLEHQAKEGSDGSDINSTDDASATDMSYISPNSNHSNASKNVYIASLGSQAEALGFEIPLDGHRPKFESSYDPRVRHKVSPGYKGIVCDDGHKCLKHTFKKQRWCDVCEKEVAAGSVGKRCHICRFDVCSLCSTGVQPNLQPSDSFDKPHPVLVDSLPSHHPSFAADRDPQPVSMNPLYHHHEHATSFIDPYPTTGLPSPPHASYSDLPVKKKRVNRMKLKRAAVKLPVTDHMSSAPDRSLAPVPFVAASSTASSAQTPNATPLSDPPLAPASLPDHPGTDPEYILISSQSPTSHKILPSGTSPIHEIALAAPALDCALMSAHVASAEAAPVNAFPPSFAPAPSPALACDLALANALCEPPAFPHAAIGSVCAPPATTLHAPSAIPASTHAPDPSPVCACANAPVSAPPQLPVVTATVLAAHASLADMFYSAGIVPVKDYQQLAQKLLDESFINQSVARRGFLEDPEFFRETLSSIGMKAGQQSCLTRYLTRTAASAASVDDVIETPFADPEAVALLNLISLCSLAGVMPPSDHEIIARRLIDHGVAHNNSLRDSICCSPPAFDLKDAVIKRGQYFTILDYLDYLEGPS